MDYDLIVAGTGGMGSAALYSAAARGVKCLGLDRFPPAHDRGSSHGESRLIRLSYFEHPDYVPLLRRSYELWDALDPTLLRRSGVLYFGQADGPIVEGVLSSAQQYDLDVRPVGAGEHPCYRRSENTTSLFESQAGWLPVERCVQQHLDAALQAGAEHRWGESVLRWEGGSAGVRVDTDRNSYRAKALVIAGGAWSADLLSELALPLTVLRKHLHWFRCEDDRYRHGFFFDLPQGQFYGFPMADGRIKVAEHSGGEPVADPLTASRAPSAIDDERIADFVAQCLPGVSGERLDHKTCFYTMTPDSQFIVDTHPDCPAVAFAAGLSGHGFKFAPAIGEALVDLAIEGRTRYDLSFLSLDRFPATIDGRH